MLHSNYNYKDFFYLHQNVFETFSDEQCSNILHDLHFFPKHKIIKLYENSKRKDIKVSDILSANKLCPTKFSLSVVFFCLPTFLKISVSYLPTKYTKRFDKIVRYFREYINIIAFQKCTTYFLQT